jgi:beta-lactamase class A
VLGAAQAGYNDIGVLTAPDGRSYSVAVMIKKTATPLPVRMTLMNNVVRAVIIQHEMRFSQRISL